MHAGTWRIKRVVSCLTLDMPIFDRHHQSWYLTLGLVLLFYASAHAGQPPASFEQFLTARFGKADPAWKMETFCPVATDVVAARVLREYGAVFASVDSVTLPPRCIYRTENEVVDFQKSVTKGTVEPGGIRIELQARAAEALQRAIDEAARSRLTITPYDGAIAGSRSYGDSLRLWNGRFFSALDYWTRRGKLTEADVSLVLGAELERRIEIVLGWEAQGIFFSTDRRRSIFSSTASPGASQHLTMLAFDVAEYGRPEVRALMNGNGWFQTVVGDPLHFTFLGVAEADLPGRGLKPMDRGGHRYWVPNISAVMN
jgi:hypothetical protein